MAQFFCSSLFQILKKAHLRILKFLAQIFAYRFSQILKKHTYESKNTPFHTNNNNFKGNNLHKNDDAPTIFIKNHYTSNFHKNHCTNNFAVIKQIDQHKAKIYNHCMYTQTIIKILLPFFFTVYKNERKEHKF